MKNNNYIYTERLYLRGIEEEDKDIIVKLRSDPELCKYFISRHIITVEEHLQWYRNEYLSDSDRYDWIAINEKNEKIGVFSTKRKSEGKSMEIGYIVSSTYYRKGYASEAVKALMNYYKCYWNCTVFEAKIHMENIASIKFIKKLGFKYSEKQGEFATYKKEIQKDEESTGTNKKG